MPDYSYLRVATEPVAEPLHLTEVKNHLRVTSDDDDILIAGLLTTARQYCETMQGKSYIARTYEMAFDGGFPTVIYPLFPPIVSVSSITYVDTDGATQTLDASYYTVDVYASPPRIYEAYLKTWPSGVRDVQNAVKVTYIAGSTTKITAAAGTDFLTGYGRTFTDADIVKVYNSGGALPAPLANFTNYHVRSVAGYAFKLSATAGGEAIDLTDDGTGTNYIMDVDRSLPEKIKTAILLIIGHLYEHREETIETALHSIPLGAKTLLMQNRVQWL
jgi:uncharacterized phiE125 gp8 family phage protein